ncbi:hypothetical protein [Streptomyces sp. NPDC012616]|uniref:hypothetical protein n=1 Tax=Streptomyces sp. NPDC012616 TaxID=3364840 RepID=UPI0036E6174F
MPEDIRGGTAAAALLAVGTPVRDAVAVAEPRAWLALGGSAPGGPRMCGPPRSGCSSGAVGTCAAALCLALRDDPDIALRRRAAQVADPETYTGRLCSAWGRYGAVHGGGAVHTGSGTSA